jgi:hypothetical protein
MTPSPFAKDVEKLKVRRAKLAQKLAPIQRELDMLDQVIALMEQGPADV